MRKLATGSAVVPERPTSDEIQAAASEIIHRFDGQPVQFHRARWRGKTQNGVGLILMVAPLEPGTDDSV